MRKIIGFRIEVRAHEVLRRAKKAGLKPEDAGLDSGKVELLIAGALKSANPAVLFETFPPTDPDSAQLSSMPGLAYSLILATLGPGFEAARAAAEQASPAQAASREASSAEPHQEITLRPGAAWWGLIQDIALDEIFRFASGLIADEAAKESCEISPLSKFTDAAVLERALAKIDSAKIVVSLREGLLSPAPSSAASLSWLAKSTAKSTAKSRGK
ncbi:MAG TPA: hypothetical protein VNH15_01855 [Elusimicrobiota bacterium]|nr:hypothetical protein [Elusimicrobiota bacterium]